MCGTAWAPSTSTRAPASCARRTISSTGLSVPSAFEMWRRRRASARAPARGRASRGRGGDRRRDRRSASSAPTSWHSSCHGTMFEWCSSGVISTVSPARTLRRAPGVRDEVDRLGHVLREDRLLVRGAEPVGDRVPGALEGVGGLLRERVDAAMDVRVRLAVDAVHRREDGLGLLRGSGRVQVGDRPATDLALQDRELLGDGRDVETRCCRRRGLHRGQAAAAASTSSRIQP